MSNGQKHNTWWRARLRKRRGKTFALIHIRELNLVAMMDMMTIILVFLLKSYSVSALSVPVGEAIDVPMSSNVISPKEAVKLTVTTLGGDEPGVIAVDEDRVLVLDRRTLRKLERSAKAGKYLIPELRKQLSQKAKGVKEIAALNPTIKFEGKVLVIADKDIPYWLLTQVLYTAADAEFEQYQLVAMKQVQD